MATVPRLQRYYQGATTSCPRMSFGLLVSPAGSAGACRVRVRHGRSRRRTGPATDRGLDCSRWHSLSSVIAHGQEQDLPGSLAIQPVTLRRSTTPDDPLRLAYNGASGTAPTTLNNEGVVASPISRLHAASSPAVYASRRALPHAMQDSLPAGGLRLCRAGVEPAGPRREVSVHVILLSRAYPGAISVPRSRGAEHPLGGASALGRP